MYHSLTDLLRAETRFNILHVTAEHVEMNVTKDEGLIILI